MKWLIKKVDGVWVPQVRTNSLAYMRGQYQLVSGVKTKFPKIVEKDRVFSVIEDIDKKEAHEADQLIQKDLKKEADKVVTQFTDLLGEVSALEDEKVKPILLKMVKAIRYLVAEVK